MGRDQGSDLDVAKHPTMLGKGGVKVGPYLVKNVSNAEVEEPGLVAWRQ